MSSADAANVAKTWPLFNPWPWIATGLVASGTALLGMRLFGEAWTAVRFPLLLLGLLAAAVALILRMSTSHRAYLDDLDAPLRQRVLLALSAVGSLLVVSALGLLMAGLYGWGDVPWTNRSLVFLCVLVVPGGGLMAWHFLLGQRPDRPVSVQAETAALLVLAAVTAFLSAWALYTDEVRANDWDSIRLFLAMVAALAFLAAPLVLLPQTLRRVVLSAVFLFHLGGIVNSAMSVPPAPWLSSRLWTYMFRPYLEFMYLTNAYHFYAPEPGPSGYLIYRIEFERPDKSIHWHWGRVPDIGDQGHPNYRTSIQYQRRIALCETINKSDPAPREQLFIKRSDENEGHFITNPIYYWRMANSPQPPEQLVGQARKKGYRSIPFHPDLNAFSQYHPSTFYVRKLMEAFARHLAHQEWPQQGKDDIVKNVKLYHAIHVIPTTEVVMRDTPAYEPLSPNQFLPYFQGTFDANGKLLDAPHYDAEGNWVDGDPFLYWLLPILKDNPFANNTPIRNYMLQHAGDPKWVRYPGMTDWTEPREH